MKAIFIAFDEAYYDRIVEKLNLLNCRGFTGWREVQGRGSKTGEPHYSTHAWPSIASAILTAVWMPCSTSCTRWTWRRPNWAFAPLSCPLNAPSRS